MIRGVSKYFKMAGQMNASFRNGLVLMPKANLNHVQNMLDENLKYDAQKYNDEAAVIQKTSRIYKPTYTLEFNREGEVLVYSCDPLKHSTVYFKYPYVFYEAAIPLSIWAWVYNPFELSMNAVNLFLIYPNIAWIPRMWYWRSLQYKIQKMYLLRGGKVAKIETQTLSGDRFTSWVETYQFNPLTANQKNFDDKDNAEFLAEEGQLKYELGVQCDNLQEMGTVSQDIVINFMKEGTVHHPELFEAIVKGYNIDTSDFVINTANNLRAREGNHNH